MAELREAPAELRRRVSASRAASIAGRRRPTVGAMAGRPSVGFASTRSRRGARRRPGRGRRPHVLEPVVAGYDVDWTGRFRGRTPAVRAPGDDRRGRRGRGRWPARHRVALVPQGGNTGLVGGSVPLAGEVVVSLRRLDHVGAGRRGRRPGHRGRRRHDRGARQPMPRPAGWAYGVDWGARDSATVGGSIATNAGGLRFVRHGGTRRQLLGVEAVLGTGTSSPTSVAWRRTTPATTWPGCCAGARAPSASSPRPGSGWCHRRGEPVVALLAFADDRTTRWRRPDRCAGSAGVDAVELFLRRRARLGQRGARTARPVRRAVHAAYLLVEVDRRPGSDERLSARRRRPAGVADAAVAARRRPPGRPVAPTGRAQPRRSTRSARPTSST